MDLKWQGRAISIDEKSFKPDGCDGSAGARSPFLDSGIDTPFALADTTTDWLTQDG
jgi:hypothetical protein